MSFEKMSCRKITSIVDEALVIAVVVLPQPIQRGEFAEIWIECGNVVPCIVSLNIRQHFWLDRRSDMNRKI